MNFPNVLLLLISNFISWWPENTFCMTEILIHMLKLVLWSSVWSILENVLCALNKDVYSSVVG